MSAKTKNCTVALLSNPSHLQVYTQQKAIKVHGTQERDVQSSTLLNSPNWAKTYPMPRDSKMDKQWVTLQHLEEQMKEMNLIKTSNKGSRHNESNTVWFQLCRVQKQANLICAVRRHSSGYHCGESDWKGVCGGWGEGSWWHPVSWSECSLSWV